MAVLRHQLPIAEPCRGYDPAPGSGPTGGFCTRCRKVVHDVSGMRESELRRFLAARVGQEICVSYRVDRRGAVELRPEPWSWVSTLTAMIALLTACAGHGEGSTAPDERCEVETAVVGPSEAPPIAAAEAPPVMAESEPPVTVAAATSPEHPATDDASQLDPLGLLPGRSAPGVDVVTASNLSATHPQRRIIEYPGYRYVSMGAMVVGPDWNQANAPSTIDLWIEARERRSHRHRPRRRRRARRAM